MKTQQPVGRLILCLLGLWISVPAAFALGASAGPREAVRASALKILGETFPERLGAAQALEDSAAVPGARAAAADPNAKDDDGTTALMRAAMDGQNELVKMILAQPGVRVDERDPLGQTALMMAAARGRTGAVRLLLEAGADPKAADREGASALMRAALFGYTKTAKALLEGGSEANQRDKAGNTALILSITGGRLDTVVLIAASPGADLDANNELGTTALLAAARNGSEADILAALIDHGADKDLAGSYKDYHDEIVRDHTPLMAAVLSRNVPGIKALLERKVNVNYRDKYAGKTALGLAKSGYINKEIVELLEAAGARE